VRFPGNGNVEGIARCYHAATVKHLLNYDFRKRFNKDQATMELDPSGRLVGQRRTRNKIDFTEVIECDALEAIGLGTAVRQAVRPGLIDISLDAYGHNGPWAGRRGFDSLVQFSSGIAAAGMDWQSADAPVSLPVQALDHATGYLLAAAAVRGVIARSMGRGPMTAKLSLARTAKLLVDYKDRPSNAAIAPAMDGDFRAIVEQTDWGPARRLLPPVTVAGAPMNWKRPATKLGSNDAIWPQDLIVATAGVDRSLPSVRYSFRS